MKSGSLRVKFIMKLNVWFNINCKDTGPLISEMMDHSLPLSKRWRVKIHLAICGVCNYYLDQLKILRALAHRLGEEEALVGLDTKLSPEAKEKIQQALKNSN